jgi:hypothetical protein
MDWTITPDDVSATVQAGTHTLLFRATHLRIERGHHQYARVEIACDDRTLEVDDINLNKRSDRVTLNNAAITRLIESHPELDIQGLYSKKDGDSDLREFAINAYDKWKKSSTVFERVKGLPASPPPWILPGFVLEEGGTIVFGKSGAGKSWMALAIALSVDSGSTKLFDGVVQTPTLYMNLERSTKSFAQRLGALNRILLGPEEEGRELSFLNDKGGTLADIRYDLDKKIREENIGFVVLDSLSRAGEGLISAEDANGIMDTLNSLGCAYMAIGHTAKGDDSSLYGSVMFTAAADLEIAMESQDITGSTASNGNVLSRPQLLQRFVIVKSNDVPKASPSHLRLEFDGLGFDTHGLINMGRMSSAGWPNRDSDRTKPEHDPASTLLATEIALVSRIANGMKWADISRRFGCATHDAHRTDVVLAWKQEYGRIEDECSSILNSDKRAEEWQSFEDRLEACQCCFGPRLGYFCESCDEPDAVQEPLEGILSEPLASPKIDDNGRTLDQVDRFKAAEGHPMAPDLLESAENHLKGEEHSPGGAAG